MLIVKFRTSISILVALAKTFREKGKGVAEEWAGLRIVLYLKDQDEVFKIKFYSFDIFGLIFEVLLCIGSK